MSHDVPNVMTYRAHCHAYIIHIQWHCSPQTSKRKQSSAITIFMWAYTVYEMIANV